MLSIRQAARSAVVAIPIAAIGLLGAGPASATEQVDQSFTAGLNTSASVGRGSPDASTFQYPGQVFTAGITGLLTRIDLYVSYTGTPTNPIVFALSASDPTTGVPIGSVLATESRLSANQAGGTVPFANPLSGFAPAATPIVFSSPANVTAGNRYVVIASSNENGWNSTFSSLWMNTAGSYPGGNMVWETQTGWQRNSSYDAGFITYVIASQGGDSAFEVAPSNILQQVSLPEGGCASVTHADLNWSGVGAGGWSQSWAQWANGGAGGAVCTRTLHYAASTGGWVTQ